MNILGRLTVLPDLPAPLERLSELARNLYWTWEPAAQALFEELDPALWEASSHAPVAVLRDVSQERLERAAKDAAYLERYRRVMRDLDAYLGAESWFDRAGEEGHVYAYFCAEYGWHESVALYSGGLGVLAGDHTKAASDLGVPLVGVGLLYPEGYFHQRIDPQGRQEAVYERRGPTELPVRNALLPSGEEARVRISVFGREVELRAWEVRVGRVRVLLLDTDVPENAPEDRALLRRLYGGDQRTRIAQEVVLGIGGVRMLRALGIAPTSWHMNEGHSAFLALERCRELVAAGLGFAEAREEVAAGTLFTVHTPVAAGNDAFDGELVASCFAGYWEALGLRQEEFFELGLADHGWGPVFSMPALALRFSSGRNGVAALHGETSRRIWNDLWPELPSEEVPIGHITNGVHAGTWIAPEVQDLLAAAMSPDWPARVDEPDGWAAVRELPAAEVWRVRRELKAQSVRFLRRRLRRQLERHEASPTAQHDAAALFDPERLTIGFARRFATYKRATLIFRDLERLERILSHPERPVQLVFAGKAHPADLPGQALIESIHALSHDPRFAGRVLFVEDYDMAVGRALTRGVDVWLNNPRRPLEASGTSGQKAAMNGVLNLSILDGWWPEGFAGDNGWAIGTGRSSEDAERADAADADALYDLLEREVAPLYYQRNADGVPDAWCERAKAAIATVAPAFNGTRMVKEYVTRLYAPASARGATLARNDHAGARELAAWRRRVREGRGAVYFSATPAADGVCRAGEEIVVEAVLNPRGLERESWRVEVVYSREEDELQRGLRMVPMEHVETYKDGGRRYRACFRPELTGRLAYGARAYPEHPLLANPLDTDAVRWA